MLFTFCQNCHAHRLSFLKLFDEFSVDEASQPSVAERILIYSTNFTACRILAAMTAAVGDALRTSLRVMCNCRLPTMGDNRNSTLVQRYVFTACQG